MIWFLAVLFLFFNRIPALATAEFSTYQNITYTLKQDLSLYVEHQIELTNNYSNIYAKEYQMTIASGKITSASAHDASGSILSNLDTQTESTKFSLVFNQPSIGKDKIQKFTLRYQISNAVIEKGKLKEVSLPDYGEQSTNDKIDVTVISPENFGGLSFASITPTSQNESNNNLISTFQLSNNSKSSKLLLAFGNSQIFDFKLSYFLQNTSPQDQVLQIPLPPDTQNQTITYTEFNFPPQNIRIDQDGNWLGDYLLSPNSDLQIEVQGQAKILPISKPAPQLDSDYLQKLTTSSTYWHPQSPVIQSIAQNNRTPKQIYDYVVSNLSYGYDRLNSAQRVGDLAALENPSQALCTEFTDLFVSIARANGIPAREIQGFAYSNNNKLKPINPNSDILHAWPQYWDQSKGWVSIDPTWAKTTNGVDFFQDLDLNHIAFVAHGLSPVNPPPPGSFKKTNDHKSVEINFASVEKSIEKQPLTLSIDQKNKNNLIIYNPNGFAVYHISLSLPDDKWQKTVDIIPPFSKYEFASPEISFLDSIKPSYQTLKLKITEMDTGTEYTLKTIYLVHYLNLAIVICILIFLLSIGGIIITRNKH
jgi:transglutaminase-like putative cysteine protease